MSILKTHDLTPPQLLSSQLLFNGFLTLRCDTLINANEQSYTYYTLATQTSAAIILAETAPETYVVNCEYRHPTGQFLLSLPGGYLDGEEDPCAAAARELREETGYQAASFTLLGSAYPYPGISNQKLYYVLAQNAYLASATAHETGELITTGIMTYTQLKEAIQLGTPIDGNLCTALYLKLSHTIDS